MCVAQASRRSMIQITEKHWLLDNPKFEGLIAVAAFLNAITIGMAVDLRDGAWPTVFMATEHVFTGLFAVEMVMKLKILRMGYFSDRWNIMDFCLVVPAMVDNWILPFFVK